MLVFAFTFIRKEYAAVAFWSIKQFKELLFRLDWMLV